LLISSTTTRSVLEGDRPAVIDAVARAYRANLHPGSHTPFSTFLTFPARPADRIIALASHVELESGPVTGLKWVASFPGNVAEGRPRASATVLLNDPQTGYLSAVVSAAPVNAHRTAASAALVTQLLGAHRELVPRVGLVGSGLIGAEMVRYLQEVLPLEEVTVADLVPERAEELQRTLTGEGFNCRASTVEKALAEPLVLFATTAGVPHLHPRFRDDQIVLHISLRDLHPEVIRDAYNVVDDVEHASRARTSFGLAREQYGEVMWADVAALLEGRVPQPGRPVVFSPFGMGSLDLATSELVVRSVSAGDPGVLEWQDH
jgi:ornithine cyclodeaminase